MSATDRLVANNEQYASRFQKDGLPGPPATGVAVLACMDARLDPARVLGLEEGDAHVIRNAGGIVTEDAIRSLLISQRALDTTEIVLIHHTRCGMLGLSEDALGVEAPFDLGGFNDLEGDVRESARRLEANPLIDSGAVRGFVYDVDTGRLHDVDLA